MQIAIVGLGLIGGSMAIDLKKSGFATEVIGVDSNDQHQEKALELKIVDRIAPLNNAIADCDLLILAVPVQHILQLLPKILDQVSEQIILDVGSIKQAVNLLVKNHPARRQFVATHPMAGTEFSGPQAAIEGLFKNKATIFCDIEYSAPNAVQTATMLYQQLGMPIINMPSADHDLHAAYVSHISHISSFALALTVLKKEEDQENIFNLASGGFDSTVRLAKSAKETWTPIFAQNSQNVLNVMDTYIKELERFKQAIEENDIEELNKLITKANEIRRIL